MRYWIEYADGRCCNFANSRKDLLDWLKLLKNELAKVLNELKSMKKGENVSEDLLEVIQLITVTMDGMKDE